MINRRYKGLLWKINYYSKPASYLFGTMHSAGDTANSKITKLYPHIRNCTTYFGESDIDQMLNKPFQSASVDWKGLKFELSPASYTKSAHQLKNRFGLELDHIQHLPPMFLTALISEKMMSALNQPALDFQLWKLAKELGLTVYGLESVEEQTTIYKNIPMTYQIRQLKKFVLNLSSAFHSISKIEKAYAANDLNALYRLTHKQLGKTKRVILYDRNHIMAQRIAERLNGFDEPCFFALGAAHLPGSQGLLRLLKKAGMRLESID